MKIAIVAQGRFHAFDLGIALLQRGHDVTLFTNYPKWAVRRFGFPGERVRSFWLHGLASRLADRVRPTRYRPERWLNPMFGRWAAEQMARQDWDVVHAWSGVAEEVHEKLRATRCLKLVMRGSAHIRIQDKLLEQEEQRTGARLERPDLWIQKREEREYRLADRVVVLSSFARDTFVTEHFDRQKVRVVPLGANTAMFRPRPEVIDARCKRILSGEPLSVLYVGTLSFRKGAKDLESIVRALERAGLRFRFVGPIAREVRPMVQRLRPTVEFVTKQPQDRLPYWYAAGDVFVFPTIEDGFAVVLAQAQANALPILTTAHCSGPDLIEQGTGWILPIRNPEAFIDRLRWCDAHRPALAAMVRRVYELPHVRTWDDVAADFEMVCLKGLGQPARSGNGRH
jgi:glycosyltransferase involved in cell wall biosynthesis